MYKFCVLAILALAISANAWKHAEQDTWGEGHPFCNGKKQSPIDLIKDKANEIKESDLVCNEYSKEFAGKDLVLINNGHTAELSFEKVPDKDRPSISGGILGQDTYILEQIHFHWGGDNGKGSEHTINSKHYDLEAHLVHRNSKFKSVGDAVGKANGITVLGLLYEVKSESDIKQIAGMLPSIPNEESHASMKEAFITGKNFPVDKQKTYFNYAGSLTTPDCNENVNWIVFDTIQGVTADELKKFRSLKMDKGSPLIDNFRKIRGLNGRNVTFVNSSAAYSFGYNVKFYVFFLPVISVIFARM